jgi:hypothetical protein
MTASGTRFSRDAVVEFSHEQPTGYHIREWRDGSLRIVDRAVDKVPPC